MLRRRREPEGCAKLSYELSGSVRPGYEQDNALFFASCRVARSSGSCAAANATNQGGASLPVCRRWRLGSLLVEGPSRPVLMPVKHRSESRRREIRQSGRRERRGNRSALPIAGALERRVSRAGENVRAASSAYGDARPAASQEVRNRAVPGTQAQVSPPEGWGGEGEEREGKDQCCPRNHWLISNYPPVGLSDRRE
jgi:hypothetical protein